MSIGLDGYSSELLHPTSGMVCRVVVIPLFRVISRARLALSPCVAFFPAPRLVTAAAHQPDPQTSSLSPLLPVRQASDRRDLASSLMPGIHWSEPTEVSNLRHAGEPLPQRSRSERGCRQGCACARRPLRPVSILVNFWYQQRLVEMAHEEASLGHRCGRVVIIDSPST